MNKSLSRRSKNQWFRWATLSADRRRTSSETDRKRSLDGSPKNIINKLSLRTLITILAFLSALTGVGFFLNKTPKTTEAAWWNDSWLYRKQLIFDNSDQDENLINFPVLVKLTSANFNFSLAKSDGSDIRFTDSDKTTLLKYEIESYDKDNREAYIWVKVPQIDASSSTDSIYMYYGNPGAVDAQDPENVWDSNYVMVQHLEESPNDDSAGHLDSTANEHNGTPKNFQDGGGGTTNSTGEIDGADSFAGDDDYIDCGHHSDFDITTNITVEVYLKYTDKTGWQSPVNKGYDSTYAFKGSNGLAWRLQLVTNGDKQVNFGALNNETWYYLVGTYDGQTMKVYKNGTPGNTASYSDAIQTSNRHVMIGAQDRNGSGSPYSNQFFNGTIDEVRISNTTRSADWIAAQYKSMNDTFITFDHEQERYEPIAYWKFDEGYGTTAHNSTKVTGINGSLQTSKVSWKSEDECISGKCLFSNGVNSSTKPVTISDNKAFGGMSGLTVSAWVKIISTKGNQIVYKRQSDGNPTWYSFRLDIDNDDKAAFRVANSAGTTSTAKSDTTLEHNKWYHLAGVYNGSQTQIYVNGQPADSTPGSLTGNILDSDSNLYIGGLDNSEMVKGYIDEVKIYPYGRSAAQIKADYLRHSGPHGSSAVLGASKDQGDFLSEGLVGYWKMDESSWTNDCSTSTVIDSSGNGNDGKSCPASTGPTGGAAGKFGNAGSFDGVDDRVQITSSSNLNSNYISIFAWVYRAADWTGNILMNKESQFRLIANENGTDNKISLRISASNYSWSNRPTSNSTIPLNQWSHIGYTYDGRYIKIYLNGVLDNTVDIGSDGTLQTNSNSLFIGTYGTSYYHTGEIDEVRIYNRALSPREVRALYEWAPGPVGYWNFDENTGTNAYDTSGNNNTGSFVNNPTWTNGKYGGAINFDGDNDYVSIPDDDDLDFGAGNFTIELWHYSKQVSEHACLIRKRIGYAPYSGSAGFTIGTISGDSRAYKIFVEDENDNQNFHGTSNGVFEWNQWNHIAMVVNHDGKIKFYQNGVLLINEDSALVSGTDNNEPIQIGYVGMYTGDDFNGLIDDVRIYNYARTQKQIIEDMNAGHPIGGSPVGSQVGYWKFDEGYGNTGRLCPILDQFRKIWQGTKF